VQNHLPHQCLVEDVTSDIKPNMHVDFTIVKFSQIFFSSPFNRSSIIEHTINFIPKCDAFGLGLYFQYLGITTLIYRKILQSNFYLETKFSFTTQIQKCCLYFYVSS
jgi:hypothetical protein